FAAIGTLIDKLREGNDLVMGNRFAGGIQAGAMVWSHRWVGNPVLTFISRVFFHTPVGDMHCGLRGFRKDAYEKLRLRATGMEFAVFTKVFAMQQGFHPPNPGYRAMFRYVKLETGLAIGALMLILGVGGIVIAVLSWGAVGFGSLDPRLTMREVIPAAVLVTLGVQTIFASFFLSIL